MYTSGDSMEFQRKFRDSVRARPTAKILISTNELPRFADKSNGLWRRMIVVPFDKTVAEEKQNRNLIYLLMSERPGIFNWAHRGYQSLCENHGFNMPKRCSEMLSGYRSEVNPARAFLESNYKYDASSEGLACSRVYDHYKSFCDADGFLPMNASNFGKEVKRLFPMCEKIRKRVDEKLIYVYTGMTIF
jgi:P4 family phage/plasmid primase-like protien